MGEVCDAGFGFFRKGEVGEILFVVGGDQHPSVR